MEEHGEPNNLYLPQEIIDEILLRLPVKSICRFKCVSNPWKAMLSDPGFVNRHFNRAQRRRLIFTDAADNRLYTLNLDDEDEEDDEEEGEVAADVLDYLYCTREQPSAMFDVPFFHCCSGLILLQLKDMELHLVNPATRESKRLPNTSPQLIYHPYGFGFDSYTGEYQLVRGDIVSEPYYYLQGTKFKVYDFQSESWKDEPCTEVPYIPVNTSSHHNENGVLLNSHFHWLMKVMSRNNVDQVAYVIVGLNVAKKRTHVLPLPPELSGGSQLLKLGAFRDWLCVTLVNLEPCSYVERYSEFWVMKEYGVKESWTKMRVCIPYAELSHTGFWTESNDLMLFGDKLVLYNFDQESHPDQSSRNLSVYDIWSVRRVGVYIESLVSVRDLNSMSIK